MKKLVSLSVTIGLILIAVIGYLNRQYIRDFYFSSYSTQQTAAIELSPRLDLTKDGSFLYRASQPEILSSPEFNKACRTVQKEKTIVLGCYSDQRLYVYKVEDSRLNGVEEVTAAHEILHAVYDRMPAEEKQELNRELILAADSITDPHFVELLSEYRKSEPTELTNEIHSILGTEIAVLPTPLENHYAKYFKDRQKIVKYSEDYQSVYNQNEAQIKEYQQQIQVIKPQIDENEVNIAKLLTDLNNLDKQLVVLRASDAEAYNQQYPIYNYKLTQYNQLVQNTNNLIGRYNEVVNKMNSIVIAQADLTKQLDSNYQTR